MIVQQNVDLSKLIVFNLNQGQLLGKEAGHQPVLSCPLVSCHRGHQQGEEERGEEGGGGGHRQAGQDPRGAAGGAQLQQATEVWSGH